MNGFLWYKGSKEFSQAVADTAADSSVSTLRIGIARLAERAIDTAVVAGGVGMIATMFLKRAAKFLWDFADFPESPTGIRGRTWRSSLAAGSSRTKPEAKHADGLVFVGYSELRTKDDRISARTFRDARPLFGQAD